MLLLDRLSSRPSFSPAPTIGAYLLGLLYPSSDHCFPRAFIASAVGNCESPFRLRFSRHYPVSRLSRPSTPPTATRAPRSDHPRHIFTKALSPTELCDQRSTFFRAPSSPELRRHLHFATKAPPAPDIRRHLNSAT